MMVALCDLSHNLDFEFLRLNVENNCIWGTTSDINSVHGKNVYPTFHILGGGRHSQGGIRNVVVSALDILIVYGSVTIHSAAY